MKRKIHTLIYTISFALFAFILYLMITPRIDQLIFGYKSESYKNDINSENLFNKSNDFNVKYFYKSGDRGSVCYATYDTTVKLAIIEANNYGGLDFSKISIERVKEIKLTQAKTYTTIINDPYPLVQQILNPKESMYLRIQIEEPFEIDTIKGHNFYYVTGNFNDIAFRNTQNTSIISFRNNSTNEILILKLKGRIYFLVQSVTRKSLLEIVKPQLID